MANASELVSVAKLYRDALRLAVMVSYQQGRAKEPLLKMAISDAKQRAVTALGNYYAAKAYDLALSEREEADEREKNESRVTASRLKQRQP